MHGYAAIDDGTSTASRDALGKHAQHSRWRRPPARAVTLIAMTGLLLAASPAVSAVAAPPAHEHTVTVSPFTGRFRCGELLLTATGGTETEMTDSRYKDGVLTVRIQRRYDGITLAGSDGRAYGATAHVNARFVLIAPDFDNPDRGDEMIHVTFQGGPAGSPGYLNEHLRIRDGIESDEVTGTCDYAE
jgi:hypothetical protein